MIYVNVILPLAVDQTYTYAVDQTRVGEVRRGDIVYVPFAGAKIYSAIVYSTNVNPPEGVEMKEIIEVVDRSIALTEQQLHFIEWISIYYCCTLGEVIKAALPQLFRLESFSTVTKKESDITISSLSSTEQRVVGFIELNRSYTILEIEKGVGIKNLVPVIKSLLKKDIIDIKENLDKLYQGREQEWILLATSLKKASYASRNWTIEQLKRSKQQVKVLEQLFVDGFTASPKNEFTKHYQCSPSVLKALLEKGILDKELRIVDRFDQHVEEHEIVKKELTFAQSEALSQIEASFTEKAVTLLHGVTASGKTEVYIHLIERYLQRGKQVLYLLPEIALTIQIVRRLRQALGNSIGIYHSGLSDRERADLWRRQLSDNPYSLIVGVRSSLFLPYQELGLVIIDEEHDSSFKQSEPAPRYNGRDAAIVLAHQCGAKTLLGSATPAYETFHNAQSGKFGLVALHSRHNQVQLPTIEYVNVAEFKRKKRMKGALSPTLNSAIEQVISDHNQVILFQNRKGYSSFIQCADCSTIPKCPHCDVTLTYYKQRELLSCNYCGYLLRKMDQCAQCGGDHFQMRTPGTEMVEEEVQQQFPEASVARMDAEVVTSKARSHKLIEKLEAGDVEVLVGTQMVAKGLDFPKVKLVGVIDADPMIAMPDFRAEERAFALLTQVSGRSGRSGEAGHVVIQLSQIDNPILPFIETADYVGCYEHLIDERKLFNYPPFSRLIEVELRAKDVIVVRNAANYLVNVMRAKLGRRVWGPAIPTVGRIHSLYRVTILLKLEHDAPFSAIKRDIKAWLQELAQKTEFKSVRTIIDVDPY